MLSNYSKSKQVFLSTLTSKWFPVPVQTNQDSTKEETIIAFITTRLSGSVWVQFSLQALCFPVKNSINSHKMKCAIGALTASLFRVFISDESRPNSQSCRLGRRWDEEFISHPTVPYRNPMDDIHFLNCFLWVPVSSEEKGGTKCFSRLWSVFVWQCDSLRGDSGSNKAKEKQLAEHGEVCSSSRAELRWAEWSLGTPFMLCDGETGAQGESADQCRVRSNADIVPNH